MLTQEEKKAAIKQRHAEQCSIMTEIMELEMMVVSTPRTVLELGLPNESSYSKKVIPYHELRDEINSVIHKFLTERLETLWLALESSQNTPIELPQ